MPPRISSLVSTLLLACASFAASTSSAQAPPPGFVVEDATPLASWDVPVAIAFLPSGRMLVAEKGGRIWASSNGVQSPAPLLDIKSKVLDNFDRGLLGLAVDPNYASNHFIYISYTVDPDSNDVDTNDDAYARVERWQVSFADSNVILPASRAVLIGTNWRSGIGIGSPSHTIGQLQFGRDGSLLVSTGDGAQFDALDQGGQDPGMFGAAKTDPLEDIGAFRSQMLTSLAGKILRIDPATGLGYPSNPFYVGNATLTDRNQSRVWCYGLRNPFRFSVKPGTGSTVIGDANPGHLFIGDVGWLVWEEQNLARTGGLNFGWPCYEGFGPHPQYQVATPAHHGCGTLGAGNPSPARAPMAVWNHFNASESVPPGLAGNATIGGVVYTGTRYPSAYRGAYFFGEFGRDWIQFATLDASDSITAVQPFLDGAAGPVCFAADPVTGDLHYVAIYSGDIFRIRYAGASGNPAPIVNTNATPMVGAAPLPVQFSSAGTFDPDDDALTYSWNFGDGTGSTQPNPSHTYTAGGARQVVLTVEDADGAVVRDTLVVCVTESAAIPSTAVLDDFNRGDGPLDGPWVGDRPGLLLSGNRLWPISGFNIPIWNGGVYGPDQEAFIRFDQASPGIALQVLRLKHQGTDVDGSHLDVTYLQEFGTVQVSTTDSGAAGVDRGAPISASFAAGDVFGARAFRNGIVQVIKNGAVIGEVSVRGWSGHASGGRLGMVLYLAGASRLDDFRGGTIVLNSNTAPTATIDAPADNSFFTVHQEIEMVGHATDAETAAPALTRLWELDLHHNNHIHPNSVTGSGDTLRFTVEDHDDGTGVWYVARYIAVDPGGLRDTAQVTIWPSIDLSPTPVVTSPVTPGTTAPATWSFWIRNAGSMHARASRWAIVSGATVIAQGDTSVQASDSVFISRVIAPSLAAGTVVVRTIVDSLGALFETNESNNAALTSVTIVSGSGADTTSPQFVQLPLATPSGASASIAWTTNEPTRAVVRYGTTPALGDSLDLTGDPAVTGANALLTGLQLGVTYFFRVLVRDTVSLATISALDSFTTQTGQLGTGGTPAALRLSAATPNPANGRTRFALELPSESDVRFDILDASGRLVWSERGVRGAGRWTLAWNGSDGSGRRVAPGVYLARIQTGDRVFHRRLVQVR